MKTINLLNVYNILLQHFGKQNWWPANTIDETIIGAILTQNTNWKNVEKAISNLKKNNLCSLDKIKNISKEFLADLIRSSGYYNQKAERLINFSKNITLSKLMKKDLLETRKILLSQNGIGPETADSILLYAFKKPIFVIDTYTIRIFTRLGLKLKDNKYHTFQDFFMKNLPNEEPLFNEYHALIVLLAKDFCKKKNQCLHCCLETICQFLYK
jgi:endonuclease-3 related protein